MKLVEPEDTQIRKPKEKRKISLGTLLATTFGLLVAISIATVIALSVGANFRNTFSLLNLRANELLSGMEASILDQSTQVERTLSSIRQLYEEENFEIGNIDSQEPFLRSLMITTPNVEGLMIYDLSGKRSGLIRNQNGEIKQVPFSLLDDDQLLANMQVGPIRNSGAVIWGKPRIRSSGMIQNISYSLVRNGELKGVAVAVVGGRAINQIVSKIAKQEGTVVYLLDEQNSVFAHSRMPQIFKSRSLYPIDEVPDQILRALPTAEPSSQFKKSKDIGVSVFESGGFDGNIYLIKEIKTGNRPAFSIGTYFKKNEIGEEINRIGISALIGFGLLLLSVLIAALLGRRLAKLMAGVSKTAYQISEFDLEKVEPLAPSRIREIDNQVTALNSVHSALNAFSQYVPRSLVKRLVQTGEKEPMSVERELTVMFTDIVGFTALTERMDAVSAAKLLNDHFDVICEIIVRHHGTIDKYMGDCVMAFWGAPEADQHHAQNALNAAKEIAEAFSDDTTIDGELTGTDLPLRIGLHTGRVIVGNIGGAARRNYTLVGDTVNVAQRMEQMGKEFENAEKVVVLASGSTMEACNQDDRFQSLGSWRVRGREQPVSVFGMGVSLEHQIRDSETVVQFPVA